ncbi:DUF397 domain-containing protein [Streptomyces sp. NPDC059037]
MARDSKARDRGTMTVRPAAWAALVGFARKGRLC